MGKVCTNPQLVVLVDRKLEVGMFFLAIYLVEITILCLLQKYGKNSAKLIVLVTAFSYLI